MELLLQLSQFSKCYRIIHYHDTHKSLPITISEEHTLARLKVKEGVRLSLEARRRTEEEEEHARIEAEE